ncbi:hypothetical protein Tco_1293967 [Tanacetum coccineum]
MVNLLNQRKKFFAEQRAQARRNMPMTQTQQRTYISTYLKHQGSWTFTQLKKLSDEEIKAKYERLVRSIVNFVPMGAEVKEVQFIEGQSPIIAWNFEYYGPKSLHDEVEVPKEINMNVVTRLNGSKRKMILWKSQEKWNIVSWKLHKSSGVHTLKTDTEMVIHMLVEKKYPLMKKVLLQMLELKLESEDDSTMALELIKFIKQQI